MNQWKYGNKLGFGKKPALLISDMQNAYTKGHYNPEFKQDEEIEIINKLISLWRAKKLPIILTTIAFDHYDVKHPNIWLQKIPALSDLMEDTDLVQIDDRIHYDKKSDKLIIKKHTSSFYGSNLANQLYTQGIDTIVVTGCTTSGCVRATVVDSMQHGFRAMVIKDAVADRWHDAHKQALYEMNCKYADVIDFKSCETIITKGKILR